MDPNLTRPLGSRPGAPPLRLSMPFKNMVRAALRSLRVRIGPIVRHLLTALHGSWWRKSVRRAPQGHPVRIRRSDEFSLAGRMYVPERPPDAGLSGVLVVHGWDPQGQRHGLYTALADALSRRGRSVLTINLRGYPGSDAPATSTGFNIEELAQDVVAAVDWLRNRKAIDEEKVSLLGHSYGADLVLPALCRGAQVCQAVIYGPSSWMDRTTYGPGATHQAFYHERYWRYMTVQDPVPLAVFLELVPHLYIPEQVEMLCENHIPLLLIDGGDESSETKAFSSLIRRIIPPPLDYHSVPGTDHFCNTAAFGELLVEDRDAIDSLADHLDGWLTVGSLRRASRVAGSTGRKKSGDSTSESL